MIFIKPSNLTLRCFSKETWPNYNFFIPCPKPYIFDMWMYHHRMVYPIQLWPSCDIELWASWRKIYFWQETLEQVMTYCLLTFALDILFVHFFLQYLTSTGILYLKWKHFCFTVTTPRGRGRPSFRHWRARLFLLNKPMSTLKEFKRDCLDNGFGKSFARYSS